LGHLPHHVLPVAQCENTTGTALYSILTIRHSVSHINISVLRFALHLLKLFEYRINPKIFASPFLASQLFRIPLFRIPLSRIPISRINFVFRSLHIGLQPMNLFCDYHHSAMLMQEGLLPFSFRSRSRLPLILLYWIRSLK
jgi:hypothetical protein